MLTRTVPGKPSPRIPRRWLGGAALLGLLAAGCSSGSTSPPDAATLDLNLGCLSYANWHCVATGSGSCVTGCGDQGLQCIVENGRCNGSQTGSMDCPLSAAGGCDSCRAAFECFKKYWHP